MATRTVAVASSVGLHARPAALFAQAAAGAGVPVTIAKVGGDADPVNAASILAVLSLGVSHGEQVELSADGDGADAALDALVALLATDHDADEAAGQAG